MPATIKKQIQSLKDNWLLVAVGLIVVISISGVSPSGSALYRAASGGYGAPMMEMADSAAYRGGAYMDEGFAPEVEGRIITKSAYLSSEVKRGGFQDGHARTKSIVNVADGFLLSENVHRYGEGFRGYYTGNYQIKVETSKYTDALTQLKAIGEIESFTETQDDITRRYTNIGLEIEVEKERLERYREMYEEAVEVEDKINLNDRIFNQERTIKYLEERLESMDNKVDYSTISFTLTEKTSDFGGLAKFSELARRLVGSFNALVSLCVSLIPWAIVGWLLWMGYRKFNK